MLIWRSLRNTQGMQNKGLRTFILIFSSMLMASAFAYDPADKSQRGQNLLAHETPKELEGIKLEDTLGKQIDKNLMFTNEQGSEIALGSLMAEDKPILLAMVYYTCPSLCNFHLNGLVSAFKGMDITAGKDFRVIAVSMNHRETAEIATKKKENYLKEYGRRDAKDWHFLVGSEANVAALAKQIGFHFSYNEQSEQYAHASITYLLTPNGTIARTISGIEFHPQTLRMGIIEASQGQIGSFVDQVLMFCFQFDPTLNKYTIYAWNIMKIGATLTVLVLLVLLVPHWLRDKKSPA
jgi:protein SCO1/2